MISLLFVFATLIEFIMVLIAKQKFDWDEQVSKKDGADLRFDFSTHGDYIGCKKNLGKLDRVAEKTNGIRLLHEVETLQTGSGIKEIRCIDNLPRASKIDFSALVMFSGCYVIFNCIYFIYFTQSCG